jgi:hypothetical protein
MTLTSVLYTSSVVSNPVFTQVTVVLPADTTTFTTSMPIPTETPNTPATLGAASNEKIPNNLVKIVVGVVVGAVVLVGLFAV